jgi:translation initiation factor 1
MNNTDQDIIVNFNKKDAFEDALSSDIQVNKVHIRIQQRNSKKCVVSIQGLADNLDLKDILKTLKRTFQCNGTIIKDDKWGTIIQLQGDHRAGIADFLVSKQFVTKDMIVMHGF